MARIFLAMNGKRINSLDDLRSNFNANQMLGFYKTKRLQKWLEEQGLNDELEIINSFEPDYDDDTLLSMLMAVFELSDEQISAVTKQTEKTNESNGQITGDVTEIAQQETVEENKKDKTAPTAEWVHCKFTQHRLTDTMECTQEIIENAENNSYAIGQITDGQSRLCVPFFFNGFFYACSWDDDASKNIAYKSVDLKIWYRDEALTKTDFGWKKVRIGDKHCFLFYGNDVVVGFKNQTWQKKYCYDVVHDISDIFEKDGVVGIIGGCKWRSYGDPENNNLFICENFFEEERVVCDYKSGVSSSVKSGCFFKDKCLCFSNHDNIRFSKFNEWDFKSLSEKTDDPVCFPFTEKVFCSSKLYSSSDNSSIGGLFYSEDGEKWIKTNIDVTRFPLLLCSLEKTFFCFNPSTRIMYQSTNGENWEFLFRVKNDGTSENGYFLTAGNGMLLLSNNTNNYLIYKPNGTTIDSLEIAKKISSQVKSFLAKELHMNESEITDDSDVVQDLHADPLQVKLWGYQLGELLGVKFPENAIPGKVIDIVSFVLKNKTPQK